MFQKHQNSLKKTILVCLLLVGIHTGVTAMEKFDEKLGLEYTKFQLENGLRVIVHEDHKAPLVSVSVWYHVGSKDETRTQKGLAHLIEHLLFQGSKHSDTDYIEAVEALGPSELNGTTGRDRTNYYQTVPRQALDRILWMEADRMGYFSESITQEKLDEQRGVVINELKQGDNQPYGLVWENIINSTYPKGHPYSWRTIGTEKDLKTVTLPDIKKWFESFYGASNAVLVISGDVTPDIAKEKVQTYFGHLGSGPAVSTPKVWVPTLDNDQRHIMTDRVPHGRFYRVWNIPELGNMKAEQLNLVSDILSVGKKSRLYQRLIYQDKLTTGVFAFVWLSQLSGQFVIQATAKPGVELSQVEEAIEDELKRFFRFGPTEDELERVKSQYKSNFIRSLEAIGAGGGKARMLAEGELYFNNPDAYKKIYEMRQNTQVQDLKGIAQEWLEKPSFTLEVHPHKDFDRLNDRTITEPPAISEPKPLVLPEEENFTLKNGLKVTFIENHSVPLLRFSMVTPLGFSKDPEGGKGTTKLTMHLLDEGTKRRDLFDITEEMERIGGRLGVSTDLDEGSINLAVLTETVDRGLDVFSDIILNPIFPEKEFNRLKDMQLAKIEQEDVQPMTLAMRLMPVLLYGEGHPYATPFSGTGYKEDVQSIKLETIKANYKEWARPENCHLFVVGDISKVELEKKLDRYFGSWKGDKALEPNIAEVHAATAPKIILIDKPGSVQSVVMAGRLVPPLGTVDEVALETFENILGATFGSRLNMNLREDKHWTYGAHTHLPDANGQRPFMAYSQVQQDKTADAMKEIAKELEDIILERPVTPEELKKTQANQIQALPSILETQSSLLSAIMRLYTSNLPADHFESYQGTKSRL